MQENIIFIGLVVIVISVLLLRWIGAWMLRINEVIGLLKDIKELLKLSSKVDPPK